MTMTSRLYTTQQVRSGELRVAEVHELKMYYLMERAGQAVFAIGMAHYPSAEHWLICCGKGNNGGDGYIVASLAKSVGIQVTVWQVGDPKNLTGDARIAFEHWMHFNGQVTSPQDSIPDDVDVVIDGLLGTGLKGSVRDDIGQIIDLINHSGKPVVAVDIPSGLCGDTGTILGKAIKAEHTVTFIGAKQGLMTGEAREQVGDLHYAGLGVDETFDRLNIPSVRVIEKTERQMLKRRKRTAHKGTHGKALFIGGNQGMGGAIILASMAAQKAGIGMAAVLCHPENVMPVLISGPEIMPHSWEDRGFCDQRLQWCDVVALGPGLGRDEAAKERYLAVVSFDRPKVMDADALFFLTMMPNRDDARVITPHPGEAAHLLGCSVTAIEADRYQSARALQEKFGGVVVLKGAGTLVYDGYDMFVCPAGNPGMATAGMGDVLTGVITALIGQRLSLVDAARLGVLIHSLAADENTQTFGERGLVASDLFPHIRQLVN